MQTVEEECDNDQVEHEHQTQSEMQIKFDKMKATALCVNLHIYPYLPQQMDTRFLCALVQSSGLCQNVIYSAQLQILPFV